MPADHHEKHFAPPTYDNSNPANHALEEINEAEVYSEWKAFKPVKSALLLKKLPPQFIQVVATLFNRYARPGGCFRMAKHAKVICLSKDGLFPSVDKLHAISLLPNIGKWFERIIHKRLLRWCNENNTCTDEQSGFTQ